MNLSTREEFEEAVAATERPLVVEFTATWCPSCKALQPFINAIEKKSLDTRQFDLGIVDIDEIEGISTEEDIPFIPTIKIYYQGKVWRYEEPPKPSRLSLTLRS